MTRFILSSILLTMLLLLPKTGGAQDATLARPWVLTLQGSATKLLGDFSDNRISGGGSLLLRHALLPLDNGRSGWVYGQLQVGMYDLQWKTSRHMMDVYDSVGLEWGEINRTFTLPIAVQAAWMRPVGERAQLLLGAGLEFTYFAPSNGMGDWLHQPQERYGHWTAGLPLSAEFEYLLSDHIALNFHVAWHYTFTDYLDGLSEGSFGDSYLAGGLGLSYSFPSPERDSDYDGLSDSYERRTLKSDPENPDTDGDGLRDREEVDAGTSPTHADTDGDGVTDGDEVHRYASDPLNRDSDNDGLQDLREIALGTSPVQNDTDGDGLTDSVELSRGTNPLRSDTDGDGLPDGIEHVSSPLLRDTDGDGLDDGLETAYGTRPHEEDFDQDGLFDRREIEIGTDPLKPDTDNDGADDYAEYFALMTDPRHPDTDGDGTADGMDPQPLDRTPLNPVRQLSWRFNELFIRENKVDESGKSFIQMLHLLRSAPQRMLYEVEITVYGRTSAEALARKQELETFLRRLTSGWAIPPLTLYHEVESGMTDARLVYVWKVGSY